MKFHARPAREVMAEARDFYARAARETSIDPSDILVYAEEAGEWLGVVRLCLEQGHYLLRTMQVLPGRQGQTLGSQILKHFISIAKEEGADEMHLIAFDYLEGFYAKGGFEKVETAPAFLEERLRLVAEKSPGNKYILMEWIRPQR